MTYAPATISELSRYWQSHGGIALGIVGNTAHTSGYHLGRDRIYANGGQGNADYSVQLARDRAGLTDAASALDLGKLAGSLAELRRFSRWLVDELQHDPELRRDVREVIYSPDGLAVQRWSGVDNKIHSGAGNGDASHRSHTHISWFRDSEKRSKLAPFRAYFEVMPVLATYAPGQVATVKPTANIRTAPHLEAANIIRVVPAGAGESWVITGWVRGDKDPDGGSDQWVTRWNGGRWEYTAKANLSAGPSAPPAGHTDAELAAAVAAATAPLDARIGTMHELAAKISAT